MTTDQHPPPTPKPPVVALVGARHAGKKAVVAGLTGERPAPASTTTTTPWAIDTKYYTADVHLVTCRVGPGGSGGDGEEEGETSRPNPGSGRVGSPALPSATTPAALATAAEAVVLVFDAAEEASFQVCGGKSEKESAVRVALSCFKTLSSTSIMLSLPALPPSTQQAARAWAAAAGPALDAVSVRLAVANKADTLAGGGRAPPTPPAWHEGAAAWAAGACFEWVDAAAGAGDGGAVEAALADAAGEAVGMARIRDALAAHMWPGLERKERVGRGGRAPGGGSEEVPPPPPPPRAASTDDDDEDGPDPSSASFDALMAEAASARARIRALPDAERRAAAAAMATRLLAALEVEEE